MTRLCAAVLAALVLTACVTQPMDETALTGLDPELGATPAPLADDDAERVADEASTLTQRNANASKRRDWIWTAPTDKPAPSRRGGGLIREDEDPTEPAARPRRQRSDEGGREPSQERRPPPQDSGGSQDREEPTRPVDNEEPPEPEPVDQPPTSPRPKPPAKPAFRAIAGVADPRGDATGQSPSYADIRQLLVESDGKNARVTVAVADDIPDALAAGEVQGIGVDFYRSDDTESDYQLFVDGDDSGWRAFLQTPDGIVQYPGSFGVGGRVFVFELPWSSLGGRKAADVDMFIDWSKRKSPFNDAGNDRAPQEGRARVNPA